MEDPLHSAKPAEIYEVEALVSDPSPFMDIDPPFEAMLAPATPAAAWQGPSVMPATSSVDPKPFAAPPGIVESRPFAAPPPSVMFPPVELHELEDQPEQMELESPSLIPPPLVASVSDQIVKGPPMVRRFTLAEVRTLRFDFKISSSPTPAIVMLAPTVKSLVAPEAVR
jgi:hypothetical protein